MSNRSNVTKQKLLDAATDIIMNQGVHQLTLDEVAKIAGVSKGDCFIIILQKKR